MTPIILFSENNSLTKIRILQTTILSDHESLIHLREALAKTRNTFRNIKMFYDIENVLIRKNNCIVYRISIQVCALRCKFSGKKFIAKCINKKASANSQVCKEVNILR